MRRDWAGFGLGTTRSGTEGTRPKSPAELQRRLVLEAPARLTSRFYDALDTDIHTDAEGGSFGR